LVTAIGGVVESPTNSTFDEIEKVQGQIDAMIPDLAQATGNPTTNYQAAPNNVDLKQFGSIVNGLLDVQVPIVTDWTSFTATGSGTTNTTYTGEYRRIGDTMEVSVGFDWTGAPNAWGFVDVPLSKIIDVAKITQSAAFSNQLGDGTVFHAGAAQPLQVQYHSDVQVRISYEIATSNQISPVSNTLPYALANADKANVRFRIPIQGWKATQTLKEHLQAKGIL